MLDIKKARENPDIFRKGLQDRGGKYIPVFNNLLEKDELRRKKILEVEALEHLRNKISKEIGEFKRKGIDIKTQYPNLLIHAEEVKSKLEAQKQGLTALESEFSELMLSVSNISHESVPFGKGPENNKTVQDSSELKTFDFEPKNHHTIGEALGLIDFERATKLAGSRFVMLKGKLATLERALIQFMLDAHTREHGYTEIYPPLLVNTQTLTGTGHLPKFEEDLYRCRDEAMYLIPTEEVPLLNIHRDEILQESQLPINYTSSAVSFRREAGSYGKDTLGIIRNHQFKNIEMVRIVTPETSYEELEILKDHAETVIKKLELPYRIIELCTGDLGFSARKTYDLEIWTPGEKLWREVSSCSNCEDFQTRRLNIRFKNKKGKKIFPHLLNGTGVSINRTLAAIMENCQTKDGRIMIPKVLHGYLPFTEI
ncbi:serine--tRNA ligase [Elusimicrobiota bacterium]